MEEKNSRRDFLRKGLSTTAFAMLATSQADALSLQNPGRDAKDPRYIVPHEKQTNQPNYGTLEAI